MLLHSLRQL